MRGEEAAAAGVRRRTSGYAGDDLSAYDQWTCGIVESDIVVRDLDVPNDCPGAGVERDNACVACGKENPLAVKRYAVAGTNQLTSDVAPLQLRQRVAVFPDQISALGIERVHDVVRLGEVHDAVTDERCSLLIAELLRPRPCELQMSDVARVDLVERTVSPTVVGAPPHQPIVGRRVQRDVIADRREPLHRRSFVSLDDGAVHGGSHEKDPRGGKKSSHLIFSRH